MGEHINAAWFDFQMSVGFNIVFLEQVLSWGWLEGFTGVQAPPQSGWKIRRGAGERVGYWQRATSNIACA